jgi:hypothetical protein
MRASPHRGPAEGVTNQILVMKPITTVSDLHDRCHRKAIEIGSTSRGYRLQGFLIAIDDRLKLESHIETKISRRPAKYLSHSGAEAHG